MNFHDPRGGTDTPGPGESVSAIRSSGKIILCEKTEETKKEKTRCFLVFLYFLIFSQVFLGGGGGDGVCD